MGTPNGCQPSAGSHMVSESASESAASGELPSALPAASDDDDDDAEDDAFGLTTFAFFFFAAGLGPGAFGAQTGPGALAGAFFSRATTQKGW